MRGRVLAVDDGVAVVRTADSDLRIAVTPDVRAGDLISVDEFGSVDRVRPHSGGDYPTPDSEVARVSRSRLTNLMARGRAMTALRETFAARGFLEVETPLVVRHPGLEVQLQAVPAGPGEWLITSPEFQMKRLLAAGLERIVQVCRCFRDEELGAIHSREFTMVEWYRAWEGLDAIIDDTEALVAAVATAVRGEPLVTVGGRDIDVTPPWPRLTVREAMQRFAGLQVDGDESADLLRQRALAAGIPLGNATAWDDIFYTAFVERVDPALAAEARPILLTDWPLPLAALARPSQHDPRVVERFEAYLGGVELANAFGELTDPVEQRRRFVIDQRARAERGRNPHTLDEKLLAALAEGLPPCAGIALGFDRLVMLATGATHIREVQTFSDGEL